MSTQAMLPPPSLAAIDKALQRQLFLHEEMKVYAVLDGASIEGLLPKLARQRPEHVCLYRGDLAPDLAECAPYLVRLEPESEFTQWVLNRGWGRHWGIFAVTLADLTDLRKHFRTFLVVKSPEGKRLYFRYYDPRVLRTYLPTCNGEETRTVFGPVKFYLCEGEKPETLLSFGVGPTGLPSGDTVTLARSSPDEESARRSATSE